VPSLSERSEKRLQVCVPLYVGALKMCETLKTVCYFPITLKETSNFLKIGLKNSHISLIGCMIPSVPYHNVIMKILSYSGFIGNKKYIQGLNLNISVGVCFFCILFFCGKEELL